jgi:Domain of unknown function (DUF397)
VISGVAKLSQVGAYAINLPREGLKVRSADALNISWKKSTYSAANGDCVEAARLANGSIGVRDSKNIAQSALGFTPAEWRTFIGAIKRDVVDPA